jgi:hypothetical protein
MMTEVVHAALRVCSETEYRTGPTCRICGGALTGYDTRKKRFALLSDDDREEVIEVIIHRAYCRTCRKVMMPDEPFYPKTRIGSPVIDLCQTLSVSLSSGQVTTILNRMGLMVDRWSVRTYCSLPILPPPAIAAFGMHIPVSIISLSALFGENMSTSCLTGDDILAACNYPSRKKPADQSPEDGPRPA